MGDCVVTTETFTPKGLILPDARSCLFWGRGCDCVIMHVRLLLRDVNTDGQELKNPSWILILRYQVIVTSSISGQALSLENGDIQTPISGNVIITGGNCGN